MGHCPTAVSQEDSVRAGTLRVTIPLPMHLSPQVLGSKQTSVPSWTLPLTSHALVSIGKFFNPFDYVIIFAENVPTWHCYEG